MKCKTEWKLWGETDPLYGVSTWSGRSKDGATPWTDDEFYALGASDWADFLYHWEQYGLNRESCLEVGCGAGRITKQLGLFFSRVYAIDVSQHMIAYAQRHVDATRVVFLLTGGSSVPLATSRVTAAFSTHVFQHFDDIDCGAECFRELYRVLDHNGTIMVHLPIGMAPASRLLGFAERVRKARADLRAARKRLLIKLGSSEQFMHMTYYPLRWLQEALTGIGFVDIEFRIFPTKSNNDLHPFVFARKRTA